MDTTPLNILLIDDDEDAYVATRYLLSRMQGWRIHLDWADTYEQGLETLNRHEHDIYLIDYRLNGHDGLEVLREAVAQGCRAPMIILTGLKDHAVDVQAMAAGAADYLVKDRLDTAHLERCIRYSLERRRLREQLEEKAARLQALANQLSHAEQSERSRIARLLHDHLQQILVSVKLHIDSFNPENLEERRRAAQEVLDQAIQVSRTLTVELNPPVLMDVGLAASLSWLTNWMHQKHDLHVDAEIDDKAEPGAEPVRFMLFHAVRELLFNVVKHAQVGRARLTMSRDESELRITVADEGVGFDPQILDRISYSGSAYGLVHLRERIELIGGRLDVATAPGEGCRVTLYAPRMAVSSPAIMAGNGTEAARPSAPAAPARTVAPERSAQPIRVLLVDDHPVVRDGLARTLAAEPDIEVVGEASDGQEAIELAHQLELDVVIMDIVMPRLNGFDATRRLRDELPHLRVIGLSMYSDDDMAEVMRKAGAVAYVSKGAPAETLLEQIRWAVSTAA